MKIDWTSVILVILIILICILIPGSCKEIRERRAKYYTSLTPIDICKSDCTNCGWNCHVDYACVTNCLVLKQKGY